MPMKCLFLFFAFVGIVPLMGSGQTPDESFFKGYEAYNELFAYVDTLTIGVGNPEEKAQEINNRVENSKLHFQQVVDSGSAKQRCVAAFYMDKLVLLYASALIKLNMYNEAVSNLMNIDSTENSSCKNEFGWMECKFNEEIFHIGYADISIFHQSVIYNIGWSAYKMGDLDKTTKCFLKFFEKSDRNYIDCFEAFHSLYLLFKIKKSNPTAFSLQQEVKFVNLATEVYKSIGAEGREKMQSRYFLNADFIIQQIISNESAYRSSKQGRKACTNAAQSMASIIESDTGVLDLYGIALRCFKKANDDGLDLFQYFDQPYIFLTDANSYALNTRSSDKIKSEQIGAMALSCLDAYCDDMSCYCANDLADAYNEWGWTSEAEKYKSRIKNCLRRDERERNKSIRHERAENDNYNLYAGMYLMPAIFETVSYFDLGGVLNFSSKKIAYEVSLMRILQKKENIFDLRIRGIDNVSRNDLSRWNGFNAHFQTKFYNESQTEYVGFLLGYTWKNFDAMSISATNDFSKVESQVVFNPSVRQLTTMITFGVLQLRTIVSRDFYFGFGLNYSEFHPGTIINRREYTIANPILENRKNGYFGICMRIGVTVGYNWGKGNKPYRERRRENFLYDIFNK
jgi:tetratricopeptide (TPR) repeat protein